MKYLSIISIALLFNVNAFSQANFNNKYTYSYISIEGKLFTKKLKVVVDFGDTEQQITKGKLYSDSLTNKKSYAAVLNFMVKDGFELVETLDLSSQYAGSGGTSGIVFIMRKEIAENK